MRRIDPETNSRAEFGNFERARGRGASARCDNAIR